MAAQNEVAKLMAQEIVDAIKQLTHENNLSFVNNQIANYKMTPENISDELYAKFGDIAVLNTQYATIDTAQIRNLYADYGKFINLVAESIKAESAEFEDVKAAFATITTADIGSATIKWAQMDTAFAEDIIIGQGATHKLYIDNLAVTAANILALTVGSLLMMDQKTGKLTELYIEDGKQQTKEFVLDGENVDADGLDASKIKAQDLVANNFNFDSIDDNKIKGSIIKEHSISTGQLNASEIFADKGYIVELIAGSIDCAKLFTNTGMIPQLYSTLISPISEEDFDKNFREEGKPVTGILLGDDFLRLVASKINLKANESIKLAAGDSDTQMLKGTYDMGRIAKTYALDSAQNAGMGIYDSGHHGWYETRPAKNNRNMFRTYIQPDSATCSPQMVKGQTYTFSADVKPNNNDITLWVTNYKWKNYAYNDSEVLKSSEGYMRMSITFEYKDDETNWLCIDATPVDGLPLTSINFRRFKLEAGDVATPWTPHIEDPSTQAEALQNSSIEIKNDQINIKSTGGVNVTGHAINIGSTTENGSVNVTSKGSVGINGGKVEIKSSGSLDVIGGSSVNIGTDSSSGNVNGTINVKSKGKVSIDGGEVAINSSGKLNVTGGQVNIGSSGSVNINSGALNVNSSGSLNVNSGDVTFSTTKFTVDTSTVDGDTGTAGFVADKDALTAPHIVATEDMRAPNLAYVYTGDSEINTTNLSDTLLKFRNVMLMKDVTINLTGDVYGTIYITGISGSGSLTIKSSSATKRSIYGQVYITGVTCPLVFSNVAFTFTQDTGIAPSPTIVLTQEMLSFVEYQGCTFDGSDKANYGLLVRKGAYAYLNDCIFTNCSDSLMYAQYGGTISATYAKGGGATNAVFGEVGTIYIEGSRPSGAVKNWNSTVNVTNTEDTTGSNATVTNVTIYEQTLNSTSMKNYLVNKSSWSSNAYPHQGWYDSDNYCGCIWFSGLSSYTTKTIVGASLTIRRTSNSGPKGQNVNVYVSAIGVSTSSGNPLTNATIFTDPVGVIARDETATFDIPAGVVQSMLTSRSYGLAIYAPNDAKASMSANAFIADNTGVKLTIKYR